MSDLHLRALTANGYPTRQTAWRAMALAGLILFAGRTGAAQTNSDLNSGIQFDFSTPGARSLGCGGAFVARADDATAAYANPAGLTNLSKVEVSAEVRNWSFTNHFTDGGRLSGTPTGTGVDTVAGIQQGTAGSQETGLSYYSIVVPDRAKRLPRWALALYRHEVGDFRVRYQTQGAILNDTSRILPTSNHLDLKIVDVGVAAALRVGSLSLGAGISRFSFSLFSVTQRVALAAPFAPPTYAGADIESSQVQQGDNARIGFNLGITWKPSELWNLEKPSEQWTLGATYRKGPRFTFSALTEPGRSGRPDFIASRKAKFAVPDVFGLGASFQPSDWVILSLEYDRVKYSALTSGFTNIFPGPAADLQNYRVNDSNQFHLGGEFVMKVFSHKTMQLSGRVGAWSDPDHKIRYDGPATTTRVLFKAGADQTHYSVGLGLSRYRMRAGLSGLDWLFARFELNAAYDYSRQVRTASLSIIGYF